VTSRQRQVLDSWLRGEPVADTCDRLRISRQRYYQLLRASLRRAAEELRKKRSSTGR
jgi:hypothetical protein